MYAITTKFLPCTNTKGARIKATTEAGSITLDYHNIEASDKHEYAAQRLLEKLKLDNRYYLQGGTLPRGGQVFVLIRKSTD